MSASTTDTRRIPMARSMPVLGCIPWLARDPLGFFLNSALQGGPLVELNLVRARTYLVSAPDDIKRILVDNNKNYIKAYDVTKPVLGNGLINSEGDLWLRQRRLMQPSFSRQMMAEYQPVMAQATQEMLDKWRAEPGANREISGEMMLLTQTIILRTMFSTDIGAQSKEIAADFASALEYFNSFLLSPGEFIHKLPTPTNLRFKAALQRLESLVYGIIAERRKQGSVERRDLLAAMMEARDPETGEAMSDKQMRDEVMTIFLAGHETTASLLGWTFNLLAQRPEVEAQVRAEMAQVLGGRTPNLDETGKLTFTRQVLDEALRLYPPAWMFARILVDGDTLGGFTLPGKVVIMLSPYVTHRLPEYWPEPEAFRPERFTAEQVNARPRYAYFPFGGGPRQCIGMPFALLEAPLILAMVMQAFRLQALPGQVMRPRPVATLRPGTFWMKIEPLV